MKFKVEKPIFEDYEIHYPKQVWNLKVQPKNIQELLTVVNVSNMISPKVSYADVSANKKLFPDVTASKPTQKESQQNNKNGQTERGFQKI